jgi:8-oxo-dGTP pyrophosphatase MutT (NUDIX family)
MRGLTVNALMCEPKIKNYFDALKQNNIDVESADALSYQRKKGGELLFAYLQIDAKDDENNKLLPYIFIRGDAVVVVPIIHIENETQEYYLCVRQRRVADGSYHLEFPAGMLDRNADNPACVAIKEMEEETGLKIDGKQLIPLNDAKPLFTSPGACDEKIYYYKTDIYINREEFCELNGKLISNSEENERIKIEICTKDEFLSQTKSNMGFVAVMLMENCKKF